LRLKNHWTPPAGTSPNKVIWGDELAFPVVFGRSVQADDETQHRTQFGLWLVHMGTGEARYVDAPFFLEKELRNRAEWFDNRCRLRSGYDGGLLLILSKQLSYDIGYAIFIYDGDGWLETTRAEQGRLLTLGVDHDVKIWDSPGPIVQPYMAESYILSGGGLAQADDPYRLAVDYTHAFSYDNGPDTPQSPEYLALCDENAAKTASPSRFARCTREQVRAVMGLLPDDVKARFKEDYWAHNMMHCEGHIWVTAHERSSGEFVAFFAFEEV
jgi:hypothetical protein